MAQNGYLSLITGGLSANKPAVPDPLLPSDQFYFATDTGVLYFWTGSAWLVADTMGVQTGVVASATQTLVAATQLQFGTAVIATCATIGNAVKLPPNPAVGQSILVVNNGVAAAGVFPGEATSTVDGAAAGASVTLTQAKSATFVCDAPGTWVSAANGGHSA